MLLLLLVYFNLDELFDLANPDPFSLSLNNPGTNYAQNIESALRDNISLVRLLFVPLFLNFFDPLLHYSFFRIDFLLKRLDLLVHDGSLGLENLLKGKPLTFNDFDTNPIIRELKPLRNEKFVA